METGVTLFLEDNFQIGAMVRQLEFFYLCKFDQLYINTLITNDKLHKFQQVDQRKKSVSQNSNNPKNEQIF